MQVIHVRNAASVDEAASTAEHVDALLLDSGNPAAAIKELGGTGRVHDWQLSRAIRDSVNVPVFLAGGLRAENVADAVTTVRPSGVDVCSGVRTEGKLDRQRLKAFMASARRS
jgi:phosphoribosylanthranilate isomerase